MSRKYMIDKWCVRCGRKDPSPFTKKCLARIMTHLSLAGEAPKDKLVVDIGCGNGRNSERFKLCGFKVRAFDMNPDYGEKLILGEDKIPIRQNKVDIVLMNYSMMFLPYASRAFVMADVVTILKPAGMLIWELYPAKDSHCKNETQMVRMNNDIMCCATQIMGLNKVFYTKDKGFFTGTKLFS